MNEKQLERIERVIAQTGLDCRVVKNTDPDGPDWFIILYAWKEVSEFQRVWNELYHDDVWERWQRVYDESAKLKDYGEPYSDLRLGEIVIDMETVEETDLVGLYLANHWADSIHRAGWQNLPAIYGQCQLSEAKPPYHVPEELEVLGWGGLADFGFDDEYDTCNECGALLRISPDSYSWQADWFDMYGGNERWCRQCIQEKAPEDYLSEHINRNRLLNDWIVDPAQYGWVKLEFEYENGLHPGQNDDPRQIIKRFRQDDIEVIFTGDVGQFDVSFSPWVKAEQKELAQLILSGKENFSQGYDTATELAKALRGEKSEYIQVRSFSLTPEEFVEGTRIKNILEGKE